MKLVGQLSFTETAKNERYQDIDRKALSNSPDTQTKSSSDSTQPYGKLSYADIKGRASVPQVALPEIPPARKAQSTQVAVLSGYDTPSTEDEKYLSVKEVALRFSVSIATIWRWSKEDEAFPKPRIIRKGTSRWRLRELLAFENRNLEA